MLYSSNSDHPCNAWWIPDREAAEQLGVALRTLKEYAYKNRWARASIRLQAGRRPVVHFLKVDVNMYASLREWRKNGGHRGDSKNTADCGD